VRCFVAFLLHPATRVAMRQHWCRAVRVAKRNWLAVSAVAAPPDVTETTALDRAQVSLTDGAASN